ncbi:MAG: T9SS C-terminal target domain-containing protein [Opitutaceae bacterium]
MPVLRRRLVRSATALGLASLLGLGFPGALRAAPPSNSFGVWDRGSTYDPREHPFLKGLAFNQAWADIERTPGVFDWTTLDRAMASAVAKQQFVYLSVNVGPDAPPWIYTQGVPRVETRNQMHDNWPVYPFYPSPAYKAFFQRLVEELGKRLRSYPRAQQERIAFIQVKTGCTGDECAYKGEVIEPKYDLPMRSAEWREFRLWAFDAFVRTFQRVPGELPLSLLFNNVAPGEDAAAGRSFPVEWKWVQDNARGGLGIKIAGSGRGHHLSGERSKIQTWAPRLIAAQGPPLFARSEMDQTWQRAWYQLNLPLSFYWGALTGLQGGQSVWDISASAMEASREQGFAYAFHFFNRYAGQIRPETATGAFCALHKGLDAADTAAYPEAEFGPANARNVARMQKIVAAYAKYGAAVDDPDALLLGQVRQRDTQRGFNDVGWDIWPENYGRFLEQIDPDATSIPLWRVGGPITKRSSIYSRFARGFEHASGKNTLSFRLHAGFSQGAEPKEVSLTVVWYDGTVGSTWRLDYDAGAAGMKTALAVTGKGDQQWRHETVTVPDAVLRRGGPRGADFALVNTDDRDDVFSLLEVHRGKLDAPLLLPPTDYTVSDQAPRPPKAEKGTEPVRERKGKRKAKTADKKD